MDEIEIPQYFICPISLQIMKDPVTTVTGITYDRESIEHWLLTANDAAAVTCPVTKQPLISANSDLTPNHTLRRLIQGWCIANATHGVDRIPTPKSPVNKAVVAKLARDLRVPHLSLTTLKKIETLANENHRNLKCMAEDGLLCKAVLSYIKDSRTASAGVEEALRILDLVWNPTDEVKAVVNKNHDLMYSLTRILDDHQEMSLKNHTLPVLKLVSEVLSTSQLERLDLEFFKNTIKLLRHEALSQRSVKSALQVLIEVCPWGRNRNKIIEAGALFELIEMELKKPEKAVTELIICLLSHLCSCADGRSEFLGHAGGIAVVSKRILRVSPATDDRALHILASIAKFSATNDVVQEMLRVGAVTKLCMVTQADCAKYLKNKAREILRMHSNVWNNSPCIAVYLITRCPR